MSLETPGVETAVERENAQEDQPLATVRKKADVVIITDHKADIAIVAGRELVTVVRVIILEEADLVINNAVSSTADAGHA